MKWDCKPECHFVNPSPAVPQICEQFVQAANKRRNFDDGDNERIDSIRKSCVNDIQTSLDLGVSISFSLFGIDKYHLICF